MKRSSQTDEAPREFAFPGLWRDGKSLVIDLAEHHFPRRCVKTNEIVEPPLETLALTLYSPSYSELRLLQDDPRRFARTKFFVISGPKKQTQVQFHLALPLSPRWQAIMHSPWGTRLLWSGAALLLVSYSSSILLHDSIAWHWLSQLSLLAAFALLFGGVCLLAHRRWALSVHRLFDGKIWVGGIDHEWLQPLPVFVPSQRMLREEVDLLLWSFWICVTGGLCLLIMVLASSAASEYRNLRFALLTGAAATILMGNRARMLVLAERKKLQQLYPLLDRKSLQRERSRSKKYRRRPSR